jgi:hypothetical protein
LNTLTGGGAEETLQGSPLGFLFGGGAAAADPSADRFVKSGWANDPADFQSRVGQMQTLMGMGFDQSIAMQQAFGDTPGGKTALGQMQTTGQMSPVQQAAMMRDFISPYTQQMRATQAAYSNAMQNIPNMPSDLAASVATWAPLQQAMTDRQAANLEAAAAFAPFYAEQQGAGAAGDFSALLDGTIPLG